MTAYQHNHYVPVWYQSRFMLPGQHRYFRLDLTPDVVTHGAVKYTRNDVHHWSPTRIFAKEDLYTTRWGAVSNVEIERFFFGPLDNKTQSAVEYFTTFQHPSVNEKAFRTLMTYMSVQKLRTPKGLAHLSATAKRGANFTLLLLQQLRDMYCAIWTECVWQIADASASSTKFIISDHPVTVYNRACPPMSDACRGPNDPDIRLHATHTYFPLSLDKVLILTNLSWVRNPYQNELRVRPNPNLFRGTIFNFTAIQVERMLTEDEVLQINYITKRRAYRYIAGAVRDWLYPERRVSTDHWKKLGDGYLLMPEPRGIHMGGEIFIGYDSGHSEAYSEYGHRPWQRGYKDKEREKIETEALYRFKAEWAMKHGPKWKSWSYDFGGGSLREDSPEMMESHKRTLVKHRAKKRA